MSTWDWMAMPARLIGGLVLGFWLQGRLAEVWRAWRRQQPTPNGWFAPRRRPGWLARCWRAARRKWA